MDTCNIRGYDVEYFDDTHQYLVDGIIVPSITTMLKPRFKDKYMSVSEKTLKNAADQGTAVHEAVERFCKAGEASDLIELRNFRFLQKHYGFKVLDNEVPVILFDEEEPIAAGRLDLVLQIDGKTGLGDIKRTSVLDKNYLCCQLNLYRRAYQQSYGTDIQFLRGIHLREDKRRFVDIPVDDEFTDLLIAEYRKGREEAE